MATAEIKPAKTVALLVEAIWQKSLQQGFDMNKLPHSICEVYEERGRLEGYELPLSHLPKSLQDLVYKPYGTIYSSIAKVLEIGCQWEAY
jgi:hypothetical protein